METGGRLVMPTDKVCDVMSHAASSFSYVNFAFCGVCNRGGSARPSGAVVHGKGRGNNNESCVLGRAASGSTGIFGPNDWPCPMCGNINWAKGAKCNIYNTNKPGHHEGGVRGRRGGRYKELDEEELEETKGKDGRRLKRMMESCMTSLAILRRSSVLTHNKLKLLAFLLSTFDKILLCPFFFIFLQVISIEMEGRRSETAKRNCAIMIYTMSGTENVMRGTGGKVTVESGMEDDYDRDREHGRDRDYDRSRYQR